MVIGMKRILVTGCGGPAGVNFIKSLKLAGGYYLAGVDGNQWHLELAPTDVRYQVKQDSAYIKNLNDIIHRENIQLLHPQPDPEVRLISENRERLDAPVFLPAKKTIEILQDKLLSARRWKEAGIPTADFLVLEQPDDVSKAAEKFGLPFWIRATQGAGARGSTLVSTIKTGLSWLDYWESRGVSWTFIAQKYLPGQDIAFQSLWNNGQLVCSQARERLEYIYPQLAPSGLTGTPSVARTISATDVDETALECILAVDPAPHGVFSVDLKRDETGQPCPTEINAGRFFTTSLFYATAGVNMPDIYIRLALGEQIPELKPFNTVGEGLYWIRHMDSGPVLVKEGNWSSTTVG